MAHQDQQFQLLVVCGFLNRTKGDRAIPVACRFLDQYPTPEELSTASRSWVLVACIVGVVIVIGVRGMVGVAADLCMRVLVPSLPRRRLVIQRRVG